MMKRWIAVMLCLVLCLQQVPVSAFAQTEDVQKEPEGYSETNPVETEPEETDPIETEPEETDPIETEPEETDPIETEPEETDPIETEPEETDPVETEPEETDPVETEPEETEPKLTEQTAQSGGFAVTGSFSEEAELLVAEGSSDKADFASMFMVGMPGGAAAFGRRQAPATVLDLSGAEQVESYIFDIDLSVEHEGEITVTLPGSDIPVLDEHELIKVIHLLDDPAAITEASLAYSIGEDLSEFFPQETAASGDPYTIYYEILDAERDGDGNVVFTTTSFSTFITYTVDFHFNGIDFSIPGESEILLSELFAELEIYKDAATATDVVFSNPELVAVEQVEGDWKLISLQPFTTEETLKIWFSDGSDMTIAVTDASSTNQNISKGSNTIDLFVDMKSKDTTTANLTNGVGSRRSHWYLYDGDDSNKQLSYSYIDDLEAGWGVHFGIRSPHYWYEMSYNYKALYKDGDVESFKFDTVTNTLFSTDDKPKIEFYRHSNLVYNDSNYCSVRQQTQAVFVGDYQSRRISVFVDNKPDAVWNGWENFPSRNKSRGYSTSDIYVESLYGPYYKSKISVVDNLGYGTQYRVDLYSHYNVSASVDGGKGSANPASQTIDYGKNAEEVTFTANSGYWIDYIKDGNNKVDVVNGTTAKYTATNVTSARNLVAYTIPIYTVSYNANGGSGAPENQTKTYDIALTLSSVEPTWDGHNFTGWLGSDSKTYHPGDTYTDNAALILTAQWAQEYTLTLVKGMGIDTVTGAGEYFAGTEVSVSATAKTGYTFSGWNGGTVTNGKFTMPASDVTLTANATANTYIVQFDKNHANATGNMNNQPFTYDAEQALTANAFELDSYKFTGWATTPDGDVVYADKATVKNLTETNGGTVTLYAQWKPIYKVTLNNQSATTAGTAAYWYIHNTVLNGVYYYTDANCTAALANYTITKPTKTGYTFGGYYTEVNGGGTQYVDANGICVNNLYQREGNITLYAKWNPITYSVKYDGNGTSYGSMGNSTHTYDVAKNLTANTYGRSGYKFVGWNTEANGSGTSYTDQQSVKNLTSTDGATVTLYAQWKPIYKITLDSQGQTTGADNFYFVYTLDAYYSDSTCENALADNKILPPTKNGYTFEGYYAQTNGEGTKYIDKDGKIDSSCCQLSANTTLYADWEIVKYDITYDVNGGTLPENASNPQEYDYNTSIVLHTPTRAGYEFVKWNVVKVDNHEVWKYSGYKGNEPGNHMYGDVELIAQWEPIEYTITYVTDHGTIPAATNYTIKKAITLADNPAPDYSFAGWKVTSTTEGDANHNWDETVNGAADVSGKYGNVTLTAQWNKATVTVNHWQQNVAGGAELTSANFTKVAADTVTSQEIIGSQYTGEVKSYEGFTSPDQSTTVTVAQNGNTIDYYYTRNSYKVTTNGDDGIESTSGHGTYKYGASVTVGATVKPGYTWAGWNGDQTSTTATFSFTMPADDVTLQAATTANTNTAYKVYHYQQNLDGTYPTTPTDTDSKTGTTGTDTAAEAKTYEGFTAQAFAQKTIGGDGKTVVDIYYDRVSYRVAINHLEVGTNSVLHGQTGIDLLYGSTLTTDQSSTHVLQIANYEFDHANPATLTVGTGTNEVNVYYKLSIADYTVRHEFYNYGKEQPTVVTETLSGTIGSSTAAAAKQITGYTAQEVQQEIIAASGTVVTIRYEENAVVFNYSTDSANQIQITGKDAKSADSETIGAVTGNPAGAIPVPAAGYKFVKWQVANDEGVMNDLVDQATVEESTNKLIPSARAVTTGNREYIPAAQDGDTPTFPNPQSYYQSTDFHAVFEAENYIITYDLDGGALAEGVTNLENYTIQTEPFTLNAPEKSGYKFTGWAVTPTTEGDNHNWDTTVAKDAEISGKYGNVTLTAQWEAKVTNIHVKMNVVGAYADKSLPFTGYIDYTSYSNTSGDNQSPVSYRYSLKHGEMDNATKINAGNTFTLTNLMAVPNELYNVTPVVKCTFIAAEEGATGTQVEGFAAGNAITMEEGTYLIEITYSTKDVPPTGIETGHMGAAFTMLSISSLLAVFYVFSRRRSYEV